MKFAVAVLLLPLAAMGCSRTSVPADSAANETATVDHADPASARTSAAPARSSLFTPIHEKACRRIEENEETGDLVGECPGAAGYSLEWSISDLRDDLALVAGRSRTSLSIPSIVAKGAFISLGPKAEWRGPASGAPDVLVVRAHVANSEGMNDSGSLVIAQLKPVPCIVAVVPPGPGQSDSARRIADGRLPACLKS